MQKKGNVMRNSMKWMIVTGLMVSASFGFADWFDGFEDGLGDWVVGSGAPSPVAEPFYALTSYTVGTFTINPHSGSYLMAPDPSLTASDDKYWMDRTEGFAASGEQGTLMVYVNIPSSVSVPASSLLAGAYDSASGKELRVGYNRNVGTLYYRGSGVAQTYTSIPVSTRSWHKIVFESGDTGTTLYINDTFIFTDTTMTQMDKVRVAATYWGGVGVPRVLVDDVSFTTLPDQGTLLWIR